MKIDKGIENAISTTNIEKRNVIPPFAGLCTVTIFVIFPLGVGKVFLDS
jgi:hypothetical protein